LALSKVVARNRFVRYNTISASKVYPSAMAALEGLEDGMSIGVGGFGVCGLPEKLIDAIKDRGTRNITAISNDAGTETFGLGILVNSHQISKLYASYVGENKNVAKELSKGNLELVLTPQGTLAEKLRAGGAGIPAFFTPTGYGTIVQQGNFPIKYKSDGSGEPEKFSEMKEVRNFDGRPHVLEESFRTDFGCVKAWKADTAGNVVFHLTARNFNPDVAKAARISVVEVEELVEAGELKPDEIHLPGIYVDRIVVGKDYKKPIAKLTLSEPGNEGDNAHVANPTVRDVIARRAAMEFKDGMYVNLGIGVPTLACNYIPPNVKVVLQSENGLLGIGPYPLPGQQSPDLINAGKETITCLPGSSIFPSSDSFAMIRGKHIDLTILGALEVSASGDLASWIIPGQSLKGMGGAMDLVSSCEKIIVTLQHMDKQGNPKVLDKCHLPLTGKGVVDMIITDLAVFQVDRRGESGLTLLEHAPNITVEELRVKTGASFRVSENLRLMPSF